jgi:hypothetical protein
MAFINKEEEVIFLQLTQYGKNVLKNGAFHPQYYKFFDDEIIYDVKYSNQTEPQALAQDRILKNTARHRPGYIIYGVETRENSGFEFIDKLKKYFIPNKIDQELLLKDELLEGDPNKQDITHTSLSLNTENANFDTTIGVTKTTGSYTLTKNYNVKVTNNYSITTTTGLDRPPTTTISGEGLKISFDEDHDFFDDELYEFELFKIKRSFDARIPGTMLKEVLIPLVEAAANSESYLKRNKFFNIYTDEHVPEVWNKIQERREIIEGIPIGTEEPHGGSTIGDIDDIYKNADFEQDIKDCDDLNLRATEGPVEPNTPGATVQAAATTTAAARGQQLIKIVGRYEDA